MGHPIVVSVSVSAAHTINFAASQTLPGAKGLSAVLTGALVSGGIATLASPGRVTITSAGNDSGITFTITGTSAPYQNAGGPLVETITGGNVAAVSTTQDFATVSSVLASGPTASTITGGSSGVASGPWTPWDQYQTSFQVSLVGYITSGTPAWGVEYTYDDVYGLYLPAGTLFPRPIAMATMPLTSTASPLDGFLTSPVRATRLTVNGTGTVQLTSTQEGM